VCTYQPNFLQISSRVAPSLVRIISISCAVLMVSRGPVLGAGPFFAALAFSVAFTGLALGAAARFGITIGESVGCASDPPSFCTSAEIRLAAVAVSLNPDGGDARQAVSDFYGGGCGVILQRGL
jgi:hypothetical protein